jgi:hypothetical protein
MYNHPSWQFTKGFDLAHVEGHLSYSVVEIAQSITTLQISVYLPSKWCSYQLWTLNLFIDLLRGGNLY